MSKLSMSLRKGQDLAVPVRRSQHLGHDAGEFSEVKSFYRTLWDIEPLLISGYGSLRASGRQSLWV